MGNVGTSQDVMKHFVAEQIKELLLSGCIREIKLSKTKVSPLGVVTNSVKKRLILALRYDVNKFLCIPNRPHGGILICNRILRTNPLT